MILECLLCAFKNGVPILDTPFYLLVVGSKNNHRMYYFE